MVILLISFMSATLAASEKKSNPQKVYPSPEGYWLIKTKDDKHDRSVIRISLVNGQLQATFVALFYVEGRSWAPTCIDCLGKYKPG